MVRGRYEFIPRASHKAGAAFDGRGFSNGHKAAEDPWVSGYCSIKLKPIDCSSTVRGPHQEGARRGRRM